ncbi:hypothetical protein [Sphingosinicella sp.]|uniref:hypothetical protein n=1 Tax=Sphingosinicella sp. TaxID=1917971 RepID=UPI0035B3B0E2
MMANRLRCSLLAAALLLGASQTASADPATPLPGERVLSFFVQLPDHGVALTTGGAVKMRRGPEGIAALAEPSLDNTLALICKLADAGGKVVGFASELEIFPADPSAVDTSWPTAWTLAIPGRGMIYLHQIERSGRLVTDIVGPTMATGKPWSGDWTVTTTVGPLPSGRGRIVGGSGEFADIAGSFVEVDRLTHYSVDGVLTGTVELRLFVEK